MVHLDSNDDFYLNNSGIFRLVCEIRKLSLVNIECFGTALSGDVWYHIRGTLEKLLQHLDSVCPSVKRIEAIAPKYDFDPSIQGNGYHSLLTIFRKCCLKILEIIRSITLYKDSWLFNVSESHATLEEFVIALGQLRACFYYMERLNALCNEDDLFPDENNLTEDEQTSAIALMYEFETLNPECFYGRCLGFQYASSMQLPLTVINQALACHSKVFTKSNHITKIASGILSASTYFRNVEERAKQIATTTRECSVDFCQSFWSISDNPTLVQLSLLSCPSVAVDSVLDIPFEEFHLPSCESGDTVTIKTLHPEHYKNPQAKCEMKHHVSARLLSAKLRMGQEVFCSKLSRLYNLWKGQKEERSPFLIIHLHGGGYVGQSSASHEVYLRNWAVGSDVPILSVDYSLAPQYRAPYQLEEAFFAYCWALKNCHLLGSTAEKVVVVGDSAGGNLAVGIGLVAAQRGVRRPDGVYPIYGPAMIQYRPGPSRMLAIMDPLIPLGILSVCLQAYLGTADCTVQDVMFGNSSEGEEDINEFIGAPWQGTPLITTTSALPSFVTSVTLGLVTPPKNFFPEILKSPPLTLHRRIDSGIFESLPDKERKQGSKRKVISSCDGSMSNKKLIGIMKSSDYVQSGLLTSNEESDLSETFCDNLSFSSEQEGRSCSPLMSDVVASYAQLKTYKISPMARSLKNNPGNSPFISPVLAPNSLLRTLKRVHITACHMDPLLDDSVTLARRLRDAGVTVDLELIPDLPHGFLNFVMLSSQAQQASQQCLGNIMRLLKGLP